MMGLHPKPFTLNSSFLSLFHYPNIPQYCPFINHGSTLADIQELSLLRGATKFHGFLHNLAADPGLWVPLGGPYIGVI